MAQAVAQRARLAQYLVVKRDGAALGRPHVLQDEPHAAVQHFDGAVLRD